MQSKKRKIGYTLQAKDQMDGKIYLVFQWSIKDNIITNGLETTCAGKMLEGFVPIYESTVMEKLHKRMPFNR